MMLEIIASFLVIFLCSAIVVSTFIGFTKIFYPFWPISRQDAIEMAARNIYMLDPIEGWSWLACSELNQSGHPAAEYVHSKCMAQAKAALEIL